MEHHHIAQVVKAFLQLSDEDKAKVQEWANQIHPDAAPVVFPCPPVCAPTNA